MAEHDQRLRARYLRQNSDVSSAAPADGALLRWNNSTKRWEPATHTHPYAELVHTHPYADVNHTHDPIVAHARLKASADQSIASNVETVVAFDDYVASVVGMRNGSDLVTPFAGIFTVECGIKWAFQNLQGESILHVQNLVDNYVVIDDHITFRENAAGYGSENTNHGVWTGPCSAGARFSVSVYHRNSAGAARTIKAYSAYPHFSLTHRGRFT